MPELLRGSRWAATNRCRTRSNRSTVLLGLALTLCIACGPAQPPTQPRYDNSDPEGLAARVEESFEILPRAGFPAPLLNDLSVLRGQLVGTAEGVLCRFPIRYGAPVIDPAQPQCDVSALASPQGVASRGQTSLVLDATTLALWTESAQELPLPAGFLEPSGLTGRGEGFLVADRGRGMLVEVVVEEDGSLTEGESHGPFEDLRSVTSWRDRTYFLSGSKLCRLGGACGELGVDPSGIAVEDRTAWVSDRTTPRIHRLRLPTGLTEQTPR